MANGCFTIDVSIQQDAPYINKERKSILRLKRGTNFSLFAPPYIEADPFLFVHNDRLFLFYESMLFGKGQGMIKMVSTTDLEHWTEPVLITHEPRTHFSYPFVFEDGGEVYMMPETGCDHNIRLYKATDDSLTNFELHKVILERKELPADLMFDYCDSCIYKMDGLYYLLTSYSTEKEYILQLFTSNSLDGTYTEHPASPICRGNKYGRCGGSLIEADGHLYRVAQDCEDSYGAQLHLLEVDELTPSTYKEHVVKENLLPTDEPFYAEGGHQLNFATFRGKTIVATDARYGCDFLLELWRCRILRMLGLKKKFNPKEG